MSANMLPPTDPIDTFSEAFYGQAAVGPESSFAGVDYRRTEDGYIMLNTGNRVMDAIGSVALNELGVDNFVNSVRAAQGGSYGRAMLQLGFGVAELGLNVLGGGVVARGFFRLGRNALRAASAARAQGGLVRGVGGSVIRSAASRRAAYKNSIGYARYVGGQQGTARAGLRFRYGQGRHTARAARQAGLRWDPAARSFRSIATNKRVAPPVGRGRTPIVGSAARARRADIREAYRANAALPRGSRIPVGTQRARYLTGRQVQGVNVPGNAVAGVRTTTGGIAGFMGSPAARAVGTGATGAAGYQLLAANRTASQAQAQNARAAAAGAGNWERNIDDIRADRMRERIDEAVGAAQDTSAVDQVDADVQSTLAAIDTQYSRAVGELRSMYQLAETDDEKNRLKFILSDIQAQADAGRAAINNVYERKRAEVSKLSTDSKAATLEAAKRALQNYELSAASLQDELDANLAAAAQETYGFGAAIPRDSSEYVQLLSAMAPVASEYRQAIGDISTEGLEWMGATMGEQSAARQADLTRLALSTRAAATSQHKAAVDKRIAAERLALAQAMQAVQLEQMQQSGANYRALLGQEEQNVRYSPLDALDYLRSLAQRGYGINEIQQDYQGMFANKPDAYGGVFASSIPQQFLDYISQDMAAYEALQGLEAGQLAYERQQLEDAAAAMAGGTP